MRTGGLLSSVGSQFCTPNCARLCTADGFAEGYAAYTPALLARARRLISDPQHAEELVQETYLRAWRGCASFQPGPGSVRGWLFTICRNLAIDMSRTKSVRLLPMARTANHADSLETPVQEPADPVDRLDEWLTRHELTEALGKLSEQHREILGAAFLHDLPYRDIADQLGIPAGTVKSRVFHALRALRRELGAPEERQA
jgi:RNA polymerase sigma-70 factor (ECF subfamily)